MRAILFKDKRLDNSEWVEGDLFSAVLTNDWASEIIDYRDFCECSEVIGNIHDEVTP